MDATRDTPSAITKAITSHGGNNPYGRPMWRVVLAQNHTRKKRGDFCTWPDGKIEQFKLEDGVKVQHDPQAPIRVELDTVRETPIFPCKGWILERWMPPSTFGSREQWDNNCGPYPEQGDYWMMCEKPWDSIPEISDLESAISLWEREWLKRPRSFEAAYKIFVEEERAEREKLMIEQGIALQEFLKSEVYPIFNSTSLSAQAVRNQCQAALGESSHLGAGQ